MCNLLLLYECEGGAGVTVKASNSFKERRATSVPAKALQVGYHPVVELIIVVTDICVLIYNECVEKLFIGGIL